MIVVLLMAERYDNGFRAEKVYACLSAIRHFFALRFLSTDFLDSELVIAGRSGAKLRAVDLRKRADMSSEKSALPICHEALEVMSASLFFPSGWTSSIDLDNKAKYLANVLGFNKAARVREDQNQVSFYPFVPHEISVLIELTLGHLCYLLTDVPSQPNSPPDVVSRVVLGADEKK